MIPLRYMGRKSSQYENTADVKLNAGTPLLEEIEGRVNSPVARETLGERSILMSEGLRVQMGFVFFSASLKTSIFLFFFSFGHRSELRGVRACHRRPPCGCELEGVRNELGMLFPISLIFFSSWFNHTNAGTPP